MNDALFAWTKTLPVYKDAALLPIGFKGWFCLPYSGPEYCLFIHVENKLRHKLDGPAVIDSEGIMWFYINGTMIVRNKYWCHPLVIANKAQKIINYET